MSGLCEKKSSLNVLTLHLGAAWAWVAIRSAMLFL